MPRTRLDARTRKASALVGCIWGAAASMGYSVSDIADQIGVGRSTLSRRKKNPDDFTVGELCAIGRKMGIPIDKLREAAIKY